MSNKNTDGQKGEESKIEKRARWEAFEFSVPEEGTVIVENVSYGDESDEHVHIVTVNGCATDCSCTYSEYNDVCKHMLAVNRQPAVIVAADPVLDPTELGESADEDSESSQENEITAGTKEDSPTMAIPDGGSEFDDICLCMEPTPCIKHDSYEDGCGNCIKGSVCSRHQTD